MADNVGITPGTGATIAADDVGGVLHQRVKIQFVMEKRRMYQALPVAGNYRRRWR